MPLHRSRPFAVLVFIAALLCGGILLGALWMLASPASYVALADRLNWRMGWPSIIQIRLEDTTTRLHLRGDSLVKSGDTLLFGDSHLHGLPASALARATNYAIGGETVARLAQRLPRYSSLQHAGAIILLTGRNDLADGTPPGEIAQYHQRLLASIPAGTPLITLAIPPAAESPDHLRRLEETNQLLADNCAARPGCQFLNLAVADRQGRLSPDYDAGDGIHLNAAGYRLLLAELQTALGAITTPPR